MIKSADDQLMTRMAATNSRFAKAGGFVLLMKFSAENPRLRKVVNRYGQLYLRHT